MADQACAAKAVVATERASGYLQQLCKHFGHGAPVEFDATSGSIAFPFGTCTLSASPADRLSLRVAASTPEDLERTKEVVGGHLERFAFREGLHVEWTPVGT
jgi:uncharacterized protein